MGAVLRQKTPEEWAMAHAESVWCSLRTDKIQRESMEWMSFVTCLEVAITDALAAKDAEIEELKLDYATIECQMHEYDIGVQQHVEDMKEVESERDKYKACYDRYHSQPGGEE